MSEELTRVLYSNNAGIKIENKGNDKDPKGIREKLLQPTKGRRRSRSTWSRHGLRPTITKLNSKCKNINLVLILELGSLHRPNWPSETHEHGRIYLW